MNRLGTLEADSIYIIRESRHLFSKLGLLWSMGKDSTVLLWLCRKAFLGQISFPAIHIDTTFKFPEMYEFRDTYSKKWALDLRIESNVDALRKGINYESYDAYTCCHELKTLALQYTINKFQFDGLFVGIRRDEHGVRSKERIFSPRDKDSNWNYGEQPIELWDTFTVSHSLGGHTRIHPLLAWTELDIWKYIEQESIPVCNLYFSNSGKRYRSLGCKPITNPIGSEASNVIEIIAELENTNTSERAGRAQDKESTYAMQKLRSLGYM